MERKRFRDGKGRRGRSNRSDRNNRRTLRTPTTLRNSEFSEKELLRILDIFEEESRGGDAVTS